MNDPYYKNQAFYCFFVPFFTSLGSCLERTDREAEAGAAESCQPFPRNLPTCKKGTKRVKRHAEQGGGKAAGSLSLKVFYKGVPQNSAAGGYDLKAPFTLKPSRRFVSVKNKMLFFFSCWPF
ncbi:hypothetical protein ACFSQ7_32200 [Paenibacillus rhizoplanae]